MAMMTSEELVSCFDARDAAIVARAALDGERQAQAVVAGASTAELTLLVDQGRAARTKVLENNLGLVGHAMKTLHLGRDDDHFNQGVVSLAQAFDKFDQKQGPAWSTYAFACVRGRLLESIHQRSADAQNLTRAAARSQSRIRAVATTLSDGTTKPATEQIATHAGATPTSVHLLLERRDSVSLDVLEHHPAMAAPEQGTDNGPGDLQPYLAALPPLERQAVATYFGLTGQARPMVEVAQGLGVSESTARRTVDRACANLRQLMDRIEGPAAAREPDRRRPTHPGTDRHPRTGRAR